MKNVALFLVFISLMVTSLFAIDPPQPIQGSPMMTSGSNKSTTVAGKTAYNFSFPEGWGLGDTSALEDKAYFALFPGRGGFGCTVHVNRFAGEAEAKQEVARLRSTFSNTKDLSNGFEATFKKAWYACQAEGAFVKQTWYSVSKKSKEHEALWEKIKQSLSVSKAEETSVSAPSRPSFPEVINPFKDQECHHPNNKLHVVLKYKPGAKITPNKDKTNAYLFQLDDFDASGFFYVKWDQSQLDTKAPFEEHLKEMAADIRALEKNQVFEKELIGDLKEGWFAQRGNPYAVVTLSGDGFLFGFALKNKNRFRNYELNDYIKRVEWWTDK